MSLLSQLSNSQLLRQSSFINNKWVIGDADLHVINPANYATVAELTLLSKQQINQAIDVADAAFSGWKHTSLAQRQACLQKWHDLILENKDDLAVIMTAEQGKPLHEAKGEIEYAASFIPWFAEQAKRLNGETIPSHIDGSKLSTTVTPVGVVALITPWNFPSAMITRKAAAAIAAGCTTIVKPASETPLSALALAHLAKQAGIPEGVFNVLICNGTDVTEVIAKSAKVRSLSFTGSTNVGKIMLHACADTVKKSAMELGGNAPFIVTESADVDNAVNIAIDAKFATSGQDCLAANRFFIHESLYQAFVEKFSAKVALMKVADGMDAGCEVGPLMTEKALHNTHAMVQDAIEKGATLHCGGDYHALGCNFYQPTVLSNVTEEMRIYQEENFAPTAGVTSYSDIDDVIIKANDTEYGLAAYVVSEKLSTVNYLLNNLDYGMVAVNTVKMTGPPIPFGGVKQSGLGREGGSQGFEPFVETKYNCIKL